MVSHVYLIPQFLAENQVYRKSTLLWSLCNQSTLMSDVKMTVTMPQFSQIQKVENTNTENIKKK